MAAKKTAKTSKTAPKKAKRKKAAKGKGSAAGKVAPPARGRFGRGRPPMEEGARRKNIVTVFFTDAELEALDAAIPAGSSRSEYVRAKVLA